ncbi:MAG TPA: cupin domain-containing protein [Thermomicrobiales bacterium]|nr:cupin domain-containing protein [Thermomicrobiales bacterium]
MVNHSERTGCVVPVGDKYRGKQGLDYVPAVSAENVGSHGLWFGTMTIPPGGRTAAHFHEHHETAIYVISGDEVEMYSGEQLEVMEICRPGDFLYIPAGLPHVAVNRSQTPAFVVAARTDPNEQESVVMRPDLDSRAP